MFPDSCFEDPSLRWYDRPDHILEVPLRAKTRVLILALLAAQECLGSPGFEARDVPGTGGRIGRALFEDGEFLAYFDLDPKHLETARKAGCRLAPPLSQTYGPLTVQCVDGFVHGEAVLARLDDSNTQLAGVFDRGVLRTASAGKFPYIQTIRKDRQDVRYLYLKPQRLLIDADGNLDARGACKLRRRHTLMSASDIPLTAGEFRDMDGTTACVSHGPKVKSPTKSIHFDLEGRYVKPDWKRLYSGGYPKAGSPHPRKPPQRPKPPAPAKPNTAAKLCAGTLELQQEWLDELAQLVAAPLCRSSSLLSGRDTTEDFYDPGIKDGHYYETFDEDCIQKTVKHTRRQMELVRSRRSHLAKPCREAGVDVSQIQDEVFSIVADLEAQHDARVNAMAADMRELDRSSNARARAERAAHEARLAADFQRWAVKTQRSDYRSFLDSIGHDSSPSGAWATAARTVKRYARAQEKRKKLKKRYTKLITQLKKPPAPPKPETRTVVLYPETRIDLPNIGVATTGGQSTPPPPGGAGTYTTGPRTIGVRGGGTSSSGGAGDSKKGTCFIIQNSISYRGGGSPRVPVGGKEGPFCKVAAYKPLDCRNTTKATPYRKYVAICESDGPMCGKGPSHLVFPTLKAAQEARPSAYPSGAWGPCK